MNDKLKEICDSAWFHNTITIVILLAAVLVGIETDAYLAERYHALLHFGDQVILSIFVAEAVLKILAEGKKPWLYFADPWNVFDFVIVVVCFLPVSGSAVTVLRLLRLLRVLKLVRALPKLQLLVSALLKSIPSMAYVSLLLGLLFYVYAVAGVFMFAKNDPHHFSSLPMSALTLFRVVTLEGWTEILYINMYGCADYGYGDFQDECTQSHPSPTLAVAYFISFVLLGTMVILNLFIGVIMNGMDEAQAEAERERDEERRRAGTLPSVDDELGDIETQLSTVQESLIHLQRRLGEEARRRRQLDSQARANKVRS